MALKKTLLAMTQKILSSMDSDYVNSINDTVEAQQVAEIIQEVYGNMVVELDLPTHNLVTTLVALGDVNKPNYMQLSDDMGTINWIKYDSRTETNTDIQLKEITYLEPDMFHNHISSRNESSADVTVVTDFNGTKLLIKTNANPKYWTSFDDEYIIFDSYDSVIDTTLQAAKSAISTSKFKTFTLSDTFIPDLPDRFFPLLQAEAKAQAFAELKQVSNNKAERTARVQRVKLQKDKQRTGASHGYNAYGRP